MADPDRFEIDGKPLACVVCGHEEFASRKALLNSRTATFLGMDFLDQAAKVITCRHCGYVHWFVPAPAGLSDEFGCPSCGETVEVGQESCESCGWTYKTPVGR